MSVLFGGLGLALTACALADTLTAIHYFRELSDGAHPNGIIASGNRVYGTAASGGSTGNGTVFAVNLDGTGFTNLHSFHGESDGAAPSGDLVIAGKVLYGTTSGGGASGYGTLFKLNVDGTGFTTLHDFHGEADGSTPQELTVSEDCIYGTAQGGGGTVFKVRTDGTSFTNLHRFSLSGSDTNADGVWPVARLVLSGNRLYGTASWGGMGASGTVFAMNTDGSGFTVLHHFARGIGVGGGLYGVSVNEDGMWPWAPMVLSGDTLYGTTRQGGDGGGGTVFALETNGANFRLLYAFSRTDPAGSVEGTNTEGAMPASGLILSGQTLYGAASEGGPSSQGALFSIRIDGSGFASLCSFTSGSAQTNSGGDFPYGGLVLSGSSLYGAACYGGLSSQGMLFRYSSTPELRISTSDGHAVLTWPATEGGFDYSAFSLESATIREPGALWNAVSQPPILIEGQNVITNPIEGTERFYRLKARGLVSSGPEREENTRRPRSAN